MSTSRSCSLPSAAHGVALLVHSLRSGVMNHRLAEMGLVPGTALTVERAAPLGGPIMVSVRGGVVAIDRRWATAVDVIAQPRDDA